MWIGLSDDTIKMFAKPKVLVPLKRRSKPVQRHINRIRAYRKLRTQKAYDEYYEGAVF